MANLRSGSYKGGYPDNWSKVSRTGIYTISDQYELSYDNNWSYPTDPITLRYVFKNATTKSDQRSFDSGDFLITKEPGLYFLAMHNPSGWSNYGGSGGNSVVSYKGSAPAGAMYLVYRQETRVLVTSVNGSGAITGFTVLTKGKGTDKSGTTVSFSGGSGSGATFTISKDVNKFINVTTFVNPGSGYSAGNVLTFTDSLPTTSGGFDTDWDKFLHGVAGNGGGSGGGGLAQTYGAGGNGGNGYWFAEGSGQLQTVVGGSGASVWSNSYLPSVGGTGQSGGPFSGSGGGGGGSGWGGGSGGLASGGDGQSSSVGSQGGAGYSYLNTSIITSYTNLSTVYASAGIELYVNGNNVSTVVNTTTSYLLS